MFYTHNIHAVQYNRNEGIVINITRKKKIYNVNICVNAIVSQYEINYIEMNFKPQRVTF